MPKYKFSYTIEYEVEAESEQDAIYEVADLMKRDWPEYLNEGEFKELEQENRG